MPNQRPKVLKRMDISMKIVENFGRVRAKALAVNAIREPLPKPGYPDVHLMSGIGVMVLLLDIPWVIYVIYV